MLQEKARLAPASGQAQRDDDEIDLLALAGAVWRGKWTILACTIVAILLGGWYAFGVAVPRYAASTSLAVESEAPSLVDIEAVVTGGSTEDAAMNTEVEVIRSRGVIERLVTDLDLTADPEFNAALQPDGLIGTAVGAISGLLGREETAPGEADILNDTVDAVRAAIAASVQRDTYILNIRVTTEGREKSQRVANRLAEIYIADQIDQKFNATETAVSWLSERVAELEGNLLDQEDRLAVFRSQTDITSLEAVEALNRQLADARDRLATAQADAAVSEARLQRIETLRGEGDLDALVRTLGDPSLRRLADAGQGIDAPAVAARLDQLTSREQSALQRQGQQAETLAGSVERLEAEVAVQSEDLAQFQQLERERQATRTLYETFLTRLKEATVQRGLQQADSRVLSAAIPGTQIAPRKGMILVLSAILGVMAGAALVFGRQFLSQGYRSADELEADTGGTTIGQIPLMPIKRRDQLLTYLNDKPSSAAAEAIRNLRTSILLSSPDSPPQVIMSTSSLPGEGKTTLAVSLTHNFAGLGKRVLLIEGDVRRRTLDEYFGGVASDGQPGIVTAMERGGDLDGLVVRDPRVDADVLLGERSRINAADLFSSQTFRGFLDALRSRYDHIIIDTPPVLVVPDARVVGQHVDTIIFNVAWNRTSKQQVREALRQLSTVRLQPSGLVLSQIDLSAMKRYGYGGKYGAYGSYGSSYYDA